jgi:hypothetical protein
VAPIITGIIIINLYLQILILLSLILKTLKMQFQFLKKFNLQNLIRPEMFALDFTKFNVIPLSNLRRNEVPYFTVKL